MSQGKKKILFLCTGNSCRSQMAEGWARHLKNDSLESYSAGIKKHGMNEMAIRVMSEAGVDISKHKSKLIEELPTKEFDYVITVCSNAHESCPIFPGKAKIIHMGFDDPPLLAASSGSEEEALSFYRRVRDEIKEYILSLPEALLD
jgi:arsenate reductase